MTKVSDCLPCLAKAAGLDRLKAELERIFQPRQLDLGHLVISIREDQIDVPLGQPRRRIAGDAAILDVDTDRFHSSKATLPRHVEERCGKPVPLALHKQQPPD
jgi:hypothetical protein